MLEVILKDYVTDRMINRYVEGRDELRGWLSLKRGDVVKGSLGEIFEVKGKIVEENNVDVVFILLEDFGSL